MLFNKKFKNFVTQRYKNSLLAKKLEKSVDKIIKLIYTLACKLKWLYSSVGQSTRFIPAVSLVRIQLKPPSRPGGQEVKTPPFHGGNTGSIPVRVTKDFRSCLLLSISCFLFLQNIKTINFPTTLQSFNIRLNQTQPFIIRTTHEH